MGNATNSTRARDRDSRPGAPERLAGGVLSMIVINVARTMSDMPHLPLGPGRNRRDSSCSCRDPRFERDPRDDARQEVALHVATDEPGRMIPNDQNGSLCGQFRGCRDARRRFEYIGPNLRDQADRLVSKRPSRYAAPPGPSVRRFDGHVAAHSQPMVSFRSRFHALRVERQPSSGHVSANEDCKSVETGIVSRDVSIPHQPPFVVEETLPPSLFDFA